LKVPSEMHPLLERYHGILIGENVMAEQNRVQFDFTDEALLELDSLKQALGVKTRAEVIRYSLRLMQWLIQQLQQGSRILVEKRDGQVEGVVFPFLGNVAEPASQRQAASRPLVAAG